MLVPLLVQLCGDTGESDIENCAQGPQSLALKVTEGQLFCNGGKGIDREEGQIGDTCRGST